MRLGVLSTLWVFWATQASCFYVQEQKPLGLEDADPAHFTLREQTDELCDAGSKYWTGTVNVTDQKSIFFWYFESRHDPATAPMMIWFSGGPGATGELGLFKGIGPCTANEDGNSTRRIEYSWTDYANVIFVDQPIGVGFSKISDRDSIAVNLHDGGRDIYSFLSVFTKSIFPETANRTWHITGESMGGHYVTGYTSYILSQERERALQGLDLGLDIRSAIIVDGYIDAPRQTVGLWEFLCQDWRGDGRKAPLMNETACAEMAKAIPACEEKAALCRQTYDKELCTWANEFCDATVGKWGMSDVKPGGRNPYDNRLTCDEPPLCSDFHKDEVWKFFNQPWVQEKLGFPHFDFELIDFEANMRWQVAKDLYLPVTRELTWLLDETDIRVLFINGNNDMVVSTPGQIRMLDEQPWKGQIGFRAAEYQDWFYKDGEFSESAGSEGHLGGTWKGVGRLSSFTVDEAGHFSPMNQPEAIGAIVRAWLRL